MRVASLTVYPVKGCAGVALTTAAVTPTGLRHDREFMVVADDGTARTQRRSPRLARIRPAVVDEGLVLAAAGGAPTTVPWERAGDDVAVSLFGVPHRGADLGDDVARWVTGVLGEPSRLVATTAAHHRPAAGVHVSATGWADSGAVTLVSRSAVHDLSDRIVAAGGEPTGLERFRMNVVLTGAPPHAEDGLDRVRVGSVELGFGKLAVRCAVTTVDQETGERTGPEPLRTLATYRRDADGGVVLGAKFAVLVPGVVSVGDRLR